MSHHKAGYMDAIFFLSQTNFFIATIDAPAASVVEPYLAASANKALARGLDIIGINQPALDPFPKSKALRTRKFQQLRDDPLQNMVAQLHGGRCRGGQNGVVGWSRAIFILTLERWERDKNGKVFALCYQPCRQSSVNQLFGFSIPTGPGSRLMVACVDAEGVVKPHHSAIQADWGENKPKPEVVVAVLRFVPVTIGGAHPGRLVVPRTATNGAIAD